MVSLMKRHFILSACCALAMTSVLPATAQRLVPRQKGIELSASLPLLKGTKLIHKGNYGFALSLTHNLKHGRYHYLSAVYASELIRYRTYDVPMQNYLMEVGYLHPLFSDRGKNFFAYLGASAVAGYEDLNKGNRLLPDGASLLDRSRFVYGAGVETSLEYFLLDRLILVGKAQARFLFGTDLNHLRPSISLGLRYQL